MYVYMPITVFDSNLLPCITILRVLFIITFLLDDLDIPRCSMEGKPTPTADNKY